MMFRRRKALRLVTAGVLAASSLGILGLVANTGTVHADPAWESAEFGLKSTRAGAGSDTIQNVYDYFSGADSYPCAAAGCGAGSGTPTLTTPVHSAADTGQVIVQSFDAFQPPSGTSAHPGCIVPKVNAPTMDRPNGSGAGINALIDAQISGTKWENSAATTCTGATVGITGQLDFARSSRSFLTSGSQLTWIPFARDAIAYAFYDGGVAPGAGITQLTSTNIQSAFQSATGTTVVGGHTIVACIMQANSGTRIQSEIDYGFTDAQATTATTADGCGVVNAAITGSGTIEENNGNGFLSVGQALVAGGKYPAGTWFVIPFSAGVWLSQADGNAPDFSSNLRTAESGVGLDGLGSPDFTTTGQNPLGGTGPSPAGAENGAYTINQTYYHTTNAVVTGLPYGRYLYTVVPTVNITPDPITGVDPDPALAELFVGTSSALCTQGATAAVLNKFGFDAIATPTDSFNCGDTTTQGTS
jgi:hypothetical protein